MLNLNTLYFPSHFSLTIRRVVTTSGKALMFNCFNISSATHTRQVSGAFQTPEFQELMELHNFLQHNPLVLGTDTLSNKYRLHKILVITDSDSAVETSSQSITDLLFLMSF